jgi:HEAT repeat protein
MATSGLSIGLVLWMAALALSQAAPDVDTLLRQGRVADAVRAFDAAADQTRTYDEQLLSRLAVAVLETAARGEDPIVAADACQTLLSRGTSSCREIIAGRWTDRLPTAARVKLLGSAAPRPAPPAAKRVTEFFDQLTPREFESAVEAARALPAGVQLELIARALVVESPEVQYVALAALADLEDPRAVPMLRRYAWREGVPGRLLALGALARAGDAAALETVAQLLPDLAGEDLLAAGVALARQGDSRGIPTVLTVLRGDDDLLQLKAAAALATLGDPAGLPRLESALVDPNLWMRLRALEYLSRLSAPPRALVWRQMADDMEWIRVRAAQATLAATDRGKP